MEQDNDSKHTSNFTKEGFKKNKVNVLEWLSQSPDFNPTEMLWKDLKQAVHMRKLTNITELKWFCTEGLKLLQDAGLTSSYKKLYLQR